VMELADAVLVHKADGDLLALAGRAEAEYRNALQLLHPRSADWKVAVLPCSARDGKGIVETWEAVLHHHKMLDASGQFTERRATQARDWMWLEVKDSLITALQGDDEVREQIPILETAASEGRIPPTTAAQQLLEIFLKRHNQSD